MTNGKQKLKFIVTEEHVKGSQVGIPDACAGACALQSMTDVKHAWVLRHRTVIEFTDGTVEKFQNPVSLTKAVTQYDESAGNFPPGVYELRPTTAKNAPGTEHFRRDENGKRIIPGGHTGTRPKQHIKYLR